MLSRPPETSSHTVLSAARPSRLWSTKASCAVLPMLTSPLSGCSTPWIMRNSVDLPAPLVFDVTQLFEAGQAGLALGLAALGVLAHPFQFDLQGLGAGVFGLLLLLQALALGVEPVGVVALVGVAGAAVEFEDPLGGVVQEVAIVGDGHHGAGEA